jgi:hypothetical protein
MKIKIGTDPEFMAKYSKDYIYPILGAVGNECMTNCDLAARSALARLSTDEFGHCVEIRPHEAESGEQLVLNTIREFAKLPQCFTYHADNAHLMDKKTFIKIIRKLQRKDISESQNIYGIDILDDCKADIEARKAGQRLLFCGCHMHISATRSISITEGTKTLRSEENVALPVQTLVWLFDQLIFPAMAKDTDFTIGRYRNRGFYESKGHGGFEYRSLGSSMLTPKRMLLVGDTMIEITKRLLPLMDEATKSLCAGNHNGQDLVHAVTTKQIGEMIRELRTTKAPTGNLAKIWVPYI